MRRGAGLLNVATLLSTLVSVHSEPAPLLSAEVAVSPQRALQPAGGQQTRPAVATNGSMIFLAWKDGRVASESLIVGSRVDLTGTLLDPTGIIISRRATHHGGPALTFDGTNFLAVWDEKRGADSAIVGARIAPDGTLLDPDGFVIDDAPGNQLSPSLASDGTQTLVVWAGGTANRDIWGTRIARGSNAAVDVPPFSLSTDPADQEFPVARSGSGSFFVAWRHTRSADRDIYGTPVSSQGQVQTPNGRALVTSVANGQIELYDIAFTGNEFVLGWSEYRRPWPAFNDIYATRISLQGSVLTPNGVPIYEADGQDFLTSVGFDGTNVLFNRFTGDNPPMRFDIISTRTSATLSVLTPRIEISNQFDTNYTPRVTFVNGEAFYFFEATANDDLDLYSARLRYDAAAPEAPPNLVTRTASRQDLSAVAFNGQRYLVVWRESSGGNTSLMGRFLAPGLSFPGNPFTVASPAATHAASQPTIASDGTDFVVAWADYDSDSHIGAIRSVSVRGDGTVGTPSRTVVTGSGERASPRMVFEGQRYLVAWSDQRSGNFEIYAAHLDSTGQALESGGVAIDTRGFPKEFPAVATNRSATLIAWNEPRSSAGNDDDVVGRWVNVAGPLSPGRRVVIGSAAGVQNGVELATQASTFLAAWNDKQSGSESVAFTRLLALGDPLDPATARASQRGVQALRPSVTSDGTQFLVVWPQADMQQRWNLVGAGVFADGGVEAFPEGGSQFIVANAPLQAALPSLATGPRGEVLAVYSSFVTDPQVNTTQLMARTLTTFIDAGMPHDAGSDGGTSSADGGVVGTDGGEPPVDGGVDGGGTLDGGTATGSLQVRVGCDCQAGATLPLLLCVIALLMSRSSRRAGGL